MEIKKYIASGILEQYVLGELNAQQRKKIELLINRYPEVTYEIQAIEDALEYMARVAAVVPPLSLHIYILSKIENKDPSKPISPS